MITFTTLIKTIKLQFSSIEGATETASLSLLGLVNEFVLILTSNALQLYRIGPLGTFELRHKKLFFFAPKIF